MIADQRRPATAGLFAASFGVLPANPLKHSMTSHSLRVLVSAMFLVLPAAEAIADADITPLPVETERAFPELKFERPLAVTHAGDGTNRVFVLGQLGAIYVFPNDP